MSDPKDHHFLPAFLLSRWATAGKLVRYYRPYREVRMRDASPSAAAKQLGLYSLEGYPREVRNVIEKDFMGPVVDDPAARALATMLKPPLGGYLSPEARLDWARFIVSLWVRTPDAVAGIRQFGEETLRSALAKDPEEYEAVRDNGDVPTLPEFVREKLPMVLSEFGVTMLPQLIAMPNVMANVAKMHWWVIPFPLDADDLLIGDLPAFRHRGLAEPDCVIALPVSPHHLFIAAWRVEMRDLLLSPGLKAVARSHNEWVAASARREVFGATRDHLALVEARLRRK